MPARYRHRPIGGGLQAAFSCTALHSSLQELQADTTSILAHRDTILGHKGCILAHTTSTLAHRDCILGHEGRILTHTTSILAHRD